MKCEDLIAYLEKICDPSYACSWDNVGLLVGRKKKEISKILITLDCNDKAITYGLENHVDMIISHHPIIFKGMKQISDENFIGEKILTLVEHGISSYAMHTNFDIVGGMASYAAQLMDLSVMEPLEVTDELNGELVGIGTISNLPSLSLMELIHKVKERFSIEQLMVYGDDMDKQISTVAISPGSGRSMIDQAVSKEVDVLITGDIGHHEGLDAKEQGLIVIDAGHYGLEHIFIPYMESQLTQEWKNELNIITYYDGNPFHIV